MAFRPTAIATATILATAVMLSAGGCAALPLAVLGTVAGLAATAVGTGADVYSLGKLDSAEMASFDEVCSGVDVATRELSLHVVSSKVKDHKLIVQVADEGKAKIDIIVEPRTATLTRLRIDVGVFGSEPTARLLLKRIRNQIAPTNDEPEVADEAQLTLATASRTR